MRKARHNGPVTIAGKRASSANAITHGATATRLLTEEERQHYEALHDRLAAHYADGNPLVAVQVERIARIHVQLTRIQDTIDAAFQKSRAGFTAVESLVRELGMKPDEAYLAGLPHETFGRAFEGVLGQLIAIALELDHPVNIRPTEARGFLDACPRLCLYMHLLATGASQDVAEYLRATTAGPGSTTQDRIRAVLRTAAHLEQLEAAAISRPVREAILACDFALLQAAADWFRIEVSRTAGLIQDILDYDRLYPAWQKARTPDLDQLDRLMRYQTSLQRQLSTAMGELLALTA